MIASGQAVLGIELGSTRIKAMLIGPDYKPLASGSHTWENQRVNGLWTYSEEAVWTGLQDAYQDLKANVQSQYGCQLHSLAAIGISAMMHGYMAFEGEKLLYPFLTWRNTNTGQAAAQLSELFHFNIPLRWSISHLYQCILNGEEHVRHMDYLTTLAGYVHWRLTGKKVLGVGDASGMLPVDPDTQTYNASMVEAFDKLIADKHYPWHLFDILPQSLMAGEEAGCLTPTGARLLDPSGDLQAGIPFCPPEGDAGTGMVATNAIEPRTANLSAGTSSFSMVVLEKPLSRPYEAIDIVTTPDAKEVAMVHCNNCTSDINDWVSVFREGAQLFGAQPTTSELYERLFQAALQGEPDAGGLVSYNYISGEPIMGVQEGLPLMARRPNSHLTLPNLMRMHLYSAVAVLRIGNEILINQEQVRIDRITGHGGYFTTPKVGQTMVASALNTPIYTMQTAGEGGAWGIGLLAAYCLVSHQMSLPLFLNEHVFKGTQGTLVQPNARDVEGFNQWITLYRSQFNQFYH